MAPRKKVTRAVIPGQFVLSINNPKTPTPDGWEWRKLTDLAELKTGHTPSRKKPEYWEDTTIPWITSVDSTKHHGGYIYETEQNISQLGLENSAAVMLPKDTVCLSRTASVGYVVMTGTDMATSQNFANWVCGEGLNPHFLRYALMLEFETLSNSFAYGTTHKTIYFDDLTAFTICCPPRKEQDHIVNKILTLEEKYWHHKKIDSRLQMILSELHFSRFGKFQLGSLTLPAGWNIRRITDSFDLITGSEPGRNNCNETMIGHPFLRVGDLTGSSKSPLYVESHIGPRAEILETLATFDGNPGHVSILGEGFFSSGIKKIVPKDTHISTWYPFLLLNTHTNQQTIRNFATGTTILHASQSIPHLTWVDPGILELTAFQDSIQPLVTMIVENHKAGKELNKIILQIMQFLLKVE
jgi:restriction endonuclease S subunit